MAIEKQDIDKIAATLLDIMPDTTQEESIPAWYWTKDYSPNTHFPMRLDVSPVQYFYSLVTSQFLPKCVSTSQSHNQTGAGTVTFAANAAGSPLIFGVNLEQNTPETDPTAGIKVTINLKQAAATIRSAYWQGNYMGNFSDDNSVLGYRAHDQVLDLNTGGGTADIDLQKYPPQPFFLKTTVPDELFEAFDTVDVVITSTNAALQSIVRLVSPYDPIGQAEINSYATQLVDFAAKNLRKVEG